ncbi:hypothetical protein RRG08_049313 [Elysia crispata]|uniref:Uncharacterized protein n=1 Tax=Elysia crispata TaxID=231223 RepID=A0AAE1B0S5_9GAST|nr:hypothetical protein RRG08_049313 [Elysia crispata]
MSERQSVPCTAFNRTFHCENQETRKDPRLEVGFAIGCGQPYCCDRLVQKETIPLTFKSHKKIPALSLT